MNMKQEGPFLVPQLWKDSISLENITNDFLESNVTGEVMNLDDFLKDLHMMQSTSHMDPTMGENQVSLPHRETMQQQQQAGKEHGGHGIPQASVRPLVRPVIMSAGKQEDNKPPASKRMRNMSEGSAYTDDEDDDGRNGFGGFTSTVCVNFSQDDLRLATIPGQEGDFDPATRRFSEEELKPQPIIRKRKKQFVPDELKNNKYWAKRCKNNEAAKRSREARRLKENQIAMRARFLEEENTALKGEVEHLKKENSDLKQMMMALEDKLNSMVENR